MRPLLSPVKCALAPSMVYAAAVPIRKFGLGTLPWPTNEPIPQRLPPANMDILWFQITTRPARSGAVQALLVDGGGPASRTVAGVLRTAPRRCRGRR